MANLLVKGSAFPGSPSHGDPFFRDDLGWWCVYDTDAGGWVTAHTEYITLSGQTASANGSTHIGRMSDNYPPYFVHTDLTTYVATTNDGSNYWTVIFRSLDDISSVGTDVRSVTTDSDSADTYVEHDASVSVSPTSDYGNFYVQHNKTGSPGNLTFLVGIRYRLVVT